MPCKCYVQISLLFMFVNQGLFFFLGHVEEIFQTFLNASKTELKEAAQKLNDKSPAPTNETLPKQSREEAI